MILDKSKPYAETIGPSIARYHQDGRDFDGDGNEIGQPQDNAEPAKRKPGRPPKVSHEIEQKTLPNCDSLIAPPNLDDLIALAELTPDGALVELGVYKGGSAIRLAEVAKKQNRSLHLFDTFCGIPFQGPLDGHQVGDFSDTSLEAVQRAIPSAVFHVGVFPDTMPKKFPKVAFLHIDADQYQSYKDAIRIFSPLMVSGGVMWFDDVGCLAGATKAVSEDFQSTETSRGGKSFVRFP